jgi:hypothetical protein
METAERALFENGIRHATEAGSGAPLDAALVDLGWRDALGADSATAVSVLFECLGASHATSSALDWLLAAALDGGDGRTAVVLPPMRQCDPPGRRSGDRCLVRGLGTEALGRSDTALVAARTTGGISAFGVPVETLERRPVRGLDPALGLLEVNGEFDAGTADHESVDWAGAVALGQLALGSELVGAARAMLELARVHALERIQFGRPIATFQAVRHRLAEALVALEAAAALLDAAWDDPSPVTAAMAKAFAGRSARGAARHCQQVLAGIGFTTEHPLHLFIRRTMVLDQLLGAGNALTNQLGTDIVRSGTLPPAFPL